jgi:hypothetical protein
VAWLAAQGVHLAEPGPLLVVGVALSNLVSNVPAVMLLLPHLGTAGTPGADQAGLLLALVSTFAGNLLLVGSIANLIVVDGAEKNGITIDWKGAICRFISPQITALAALGRTPRPRHGFGSYFSPSVPFWPRPALVRDEASATGVAELLGDAPALVLNVNGAVTVGRTAEQALALAWFLEDAARVELAALASGLADTAPTLPPAAAQQRATWEGRIAERVWEYLLRDDPE